MIAHPGGLPVRKVFDFYILSMARYSPFELSIDRLLSLPGSQNGLYDSQFQHR
jgi:hypothetical protein